MTHGRAVAAMLLATLLWSIAGPVTRLLDSAGSFEATFWRSFFNALALFVLLARQRGARSLATALGRADLVLWISSACWTVMFTAFMVAITLTTVANVLVTMALAPLMTALLARVALGHRLPRRTWFAIVVAGFGIAWIYAREIAVADPRALAGIAVALGVPVAAAVNWTAIQHRKHSGRDLMPAVLVGALGSAVASFAPALPLAASAHDIALLALLGAVQLAIPCLIAVAAARALSAPEAALLSLLEIVFGVTWTWLIAAEAPGRHALVGGALVIGALLANEVLGLRAARRGLSSPRGVPS